MAASIGTRFVGPTETRCGGRFEAVLPEPTEFERDLQDGIFDRDIGRAEKRVDAAKGPRRFAWIPRIRRKA